MPLHGAADRDATGGVNKPLKDLAWGLATQRVAVARFDEPAGAATVTEEYVPRALAAVRSLREHVDRIFVLGHSMGGKVAARVVAADPAMAGMVLLAADARTCPRPRPPFGYPATYWLDLRDYDPLAAAAAPHKPMLTLRSGRDHQRRSGGRPGHRRLAAPDVAGPGRSHGDSTARTVPSGSGVRCGAVRRRRRASTGRAGRSG